MKKILLIHIIIFCGYMGYSQLDCPRLLSPMNGDIDVAVDATISWNGIVGAPSYLISIGTTLGGTDIVNNQNVGNATSYQPPLGLPENTNIFVTITIFFFNAENIICATETFRTEDVTTPPACTTPRFPEAGATNVNSGTSISWNYAPTATGYRLSIGTTPGGTDILNNENIVGAPFYQPLVDLPLDDEIFVTIIPYNENGNASPSCEEYSFTTGALAMLPGCASLISPINGAINVPLSPLIEWTAVPEAVGYRVTIGTTPFNSNVLDNVTFTENRTVVVDFEPNLTFFIRIIPFNAAGEALGCTQQSFSTILGCGPYFNTTTGEFVDLKPEINIPDTVPFCINETQITVETEDTADGYRWFKLDQNDNETLLSSTDQVTLTEGGRYLYEAFNTISQSGSTIECVNSKTFNVTTSEVARNLSLKVTGQNGSIDIDVLHDGIGDYEYAIDDENGLYQASASFNNIDPGLHTFFVRDKNGCGTASIKFEQDISLEGFPKFFTPNGDGINDYWQIIPPPNNGEIQVRQIEIYNRYGNLIVQIDPSTRGWDGNFNGQPLPASDYWFKTISVKNKIIQGHFTLKR